MTMRNNSAQKKTSLNRGPLKKKKAPFFAFLSFQYSQSFQLLRESPFHRASSSDPFAIGVLDPSPALNTIVAGYFFRSQSHAVIWLIISAVVLAADLSAWTIEHVATKHLGLCNQFLAHSVLVALLISCQ